MLYGALILSVLLLLAANVIVWRSSAGSLAGLAWALGIVLVLMALGIFSSAVLLQVVLLVMAGLTWQARQWRPRSYVVASSGLTLAAYLVVGWFAYQDIRELQAKYPFISMESRLGPRQAVWTTAPQTASASPMVEHLEAELDYTLQTKWPTSQRLRSLQDLHETMVRVFINRPGFGVSRMNAMFAGDLRRGLRHEPPIPQPAAGTALVWSTAYLTQASSTPSNEDTAKLQDLHGWYVLDFVHPAGFGYIKDRRHVAGFQSHQISELPPPAKDGWRLQTLDLIGLVLHEQPTAYVSAHLPRMDELREVPRRPLDDFETLGLQALRNGEDLFVREGPGGRRLLGAIRSVRQCLACHEGERGDLLGAFAYTFTRTVGIGRKGRFCPASHASPHYAPGDP